MGYVHDIGLLATILFRERPTLWLALPSTGQTYIVWNSWSPNSTYFPFGIRQVQKVNKHLKPHQQKYILYLCVVKAPLNTSNVKALLNTSNVKALIRAMFTVFVNNSLPQNCWRAELKFPGSARLKFKPWMCNKICFWSVSIYREYLVNIVDISWTSTVMKCNWQ